MSVDLCTHDNIIKATSGASVAMATCKPRPSINFSSLLFIVIIIINAIITLTKINISHDC